MKLNASLFLLPIIACSSTSYGSSDETSSSSNSDNYLSVTINDQTCKVTLKPLDLEGKLPKHFYNYGFLINKDLLKPSKIYIDDKKLRLPQNRSHAVVSLSKTKDETTKANMEAYNKDVFNGIKPPNFNGLKFDRSKHIALYLKEDSSKPRKVVEKPRTASKFESNAHNTLKKLFSSIDRPIYPNVAIGIINATNAKDGRVQVITPVPQNGRNDLARYFYTIPYSQGDTLVEVKIENQILKLTKHLEKSDKRDPNLIVEMDIIGYNMETPIFPKGKFATKIRSATRAELKCSPSGLQTPHFNLFFKFNLLNSEDSSESSESEKSPRGKTRAPKSRRHHKYESSDSNSP